MPEFNIKLNHKNIDVITDENQYIYICTKKYNTPFLGLVYVFLKTYTIKK